MEPQTSSMVTFCTKTIPMMTAERKASSIFGLRINHNSLVGFRTVNWIESFGQFLMQAAQITQFALEVMVLGNSNNGQPGAFSVPLKQEADVHFAQISGVPRNASIPVRA